MPPARNPRKTAAPNAAQAAAKGLEHIAAAIDALRAGRAVRLNDRGVHTMFAAETIPAAALQRLTRPLLILSHARARTLKIRLYTPDVVALAVRRGTSPADLKAIADPTADLETPLKGPFEAKRTALAPAYGAAVTLAKLAGLLPAAVVVKGPLRGAADVATADVTGYEALAAASLTIVTRARVPLDGAENTELVAFRAGDGGPENYAVVIGEPRGAVLTRLHSECFTGDLLGSLKCDCGVQLRGAIAAIAAAGGGVLLYLAQEGRGIGLINKLRAYRLQDQGFDTIEANQRLGFAADERVYAVAARMLQLLGLHTVRLMTNNPDKVTGLTAAGIDVAERVPHAFPATVHNAAYLKTKADKAGHLL
jgi:GTP cyclohydrolase II